MSYRASEMYYCLANVLYSLKETKVGVLAANVAPALAAFVKPGNEQQELSKNAAVISHRA